ncbi:MAG: copper-binding protein [Rhodomicrobiaceae bacterium]
MKKTYGLRTFLIAAAFSGALTGAASTAMAEGNLAVRCETLPSLTFGTDITGYKVSQDTYELETGKCYKLEIASTGNKEYALRAPGFFHNIWIRKVEAGGIEIKAKNLYELEFEDEGKADLFFVPIVPGSYEMVAQGLEERGTKATFNVK